MKQGKEIPSHEVNYSDTVGDQFRTAAEAHRRLDEIGGIPVTATGLPGRALDTWSASGILPGTMSPNWQPPAAPEANTDDPARLGFGVTSVPNFGPSTANTEEIFKDTLGVHNRWKR
jgi:hypothetical protein